MTFNIHSLLHVVQSVRKSGPLWATSTFPFENGIYLCKKWLNGPRTVSIQLSTKWLQMVRYQSSVSASSNVTCTYYCRNILFNKQKIAINALTAEKSNVILLGASDDPEGHDKHLVSSIINNLNAKPKLFSRCKFRNAIFHGTSYTRRTRNDDSISLLNCNTIIQIRSFVLIDGKCFMIATPLTTAPVTSPTELPHMAEVLEIGNDPQIFDIDSIKQKLILSI